MSIQKHLKQLRRQLSYPTISIQLCVLGLLAGISASFFIVAFKWCIENIQLLYLFHPDDFTTLDAPTRFLLPLIGAVLIAGVGLITQFKHFRLGIPFVIYRLKSFYGMMPMRNTFNQFFGGIIAMCSGFSVGREGPAVHLGAGASSYLGSWLKLPYNSVRTLTACGIAAAISASFNTPLAAVIFVMEVVMREYKIHIFIPVMLASVVGALANRLVFGDENYLTGLHITELGLEHYPYLALMGLFIGCFAFAFNRQLLEIMRSFKNTNFIPRLLLAGLVTAVIGLIVPEALGTGLGAIYVAESHTHNAQLLMTVFICKAILTFFAIGLGVPGGVIGPILGLGMMLGTLLALLASLFIGDLDAYANVYGVLGLAGLMAACLNAPLAALTTVMEMTYSQEIIVPAMFVIVCAYVIAVQVFKNRSLFILQLELQKLDYLTPPTYEILQKIGVQAEMQRNYILVKSKEESTLHKALSRAKKRFVIYKQDIEGGSSFQLVEYNNQSNLLDCDSPFVFTELQGVESRYTLAEVYQLLEADRAGTVYIFESEIDTIVGVVSWQQLRRHFSKNAHKGQE